MKMFYGKTPIQSMNIKHYEVSTQDCTAIPSDLQSGVTCVSKGKKITGTGKSFEFASYGKIDTNLSLFSPSIINVVEIASVAYPVKLSVALGEMKNIDFSTKQTIGYVVIDNVEYPITVQVNGLVLTFICEKTIELQYFCGKDNYV